jgi:predicted nucleotidyltransferase
VNPLLGDLPVILSKLRQKLAELYGERLVEMVLYGSQARGDVTLESDIDVLVVLEGSVNPGDEIARTGDVVTALSLEHNTVISCLFVSAERFHNEQSPLLLNVRREGVRI